jgi:glutamate dehydrogenase
MKLVVTSHDRRPAKDDLSEKMSATLALLGKNYSADKLPVVSQLVDILASNTPAYYLAAPTAVQLAGWVRSLFDFISARHEEVAVELLPLTGQGGTLLVTNCSDAPFLVHTIQLCLNKRHIHFRVVTHPIFRTTRSDKKLSAISSIEGHGDPESLVVFELEKAPDDVLHGLEAEIVEALQDVLVINRSSEQINTRLQVLAECDQCSQYADFFNWLGEDNVSLFAYRCLRIKPENAKGDRLVEPEEGLAFGLVEKLFLNYKADVRKVADFNPRFQELLLRKERVGIEVLDRASPVLRNERLIYIGARQELSDGSWLEHGFIGLPSDSALSDQTLNVPTLRNKIEEALTVLGVPHGSHDYRKIIEILNTYPKIELFFMNREEIIETVRSFALLYRHGTVRVIPAKGLAIRGVTLLLIMPKSFYSDDNLGRVENFLSRYFSVPEVFSRIIHLSQDYMSIHVNLQPQGDEVVVDIDKLERGLTHITQPWSQKLHNLLERTLGDVDGGRLWEKYRRSFSVDYRALVHPRFAVRDISNMEKVQASGEDTIDLWGPFSGKEQYYRLQFYSQRETYLNDLMPFLENLNLCVIDETDFTVPCGSDTIFIKSFSIRNRDERAISLSEIRETLLETLLALRSGAVENDYLHYLLVLTGLSWRQIDVFRGYRNYYFQLGSPFTKKRVAFAFINNPEVSTLLYRYFEARFAPREDWPSMADREEQGLMPIRFDLATALEGVSDINEDQILRAFFNLIDSTIRTNFFARVDQPDYFFAFKISAIGIIDMPAPRPMYEVYVHSAEMEGIHLRGGKVARGGIRWSDRPDDFRTEVLGLMKTQMTKNTLIVPVGSKGGFVVKTPFNTREEGAELSKEAYKNLMRGLLDLTDNRSGEEVIQPSGVIAYDSLDSYLVVAADKGTAHLPDTANGVSGEYDFWLDDAFASGGSAGYDHKKLGITASGAWVSVKRHFQELGLDTQREPFTVIGIGDMGGDVFGNGMLLSPCIKLMAAFNHLHIFIDPDPDPDTSFKERKRLFELPRSSWGDYDKKLISKGGGIFERSAKDIPLSKQVREWLGIRHESLDGQSLVRHILAARADLLWNGGIGTYVKSSGESNEDAGDRANDPVRIDATQLQVKVVGEGGNLGMTQLARIEYALAGGRINTDAIDNSGGVDCSDHEVNLKILMGQLAKAGKVTSRQQRDEILAGMTGEVCDDVLANNYTQSLCLSLDMLRSAADIEPFLGLLDRLSRAGILDRRSEFLPSSREIQTRADYKLVKPELAILLAYSKMHLYQVLLESAIPDAEIASDFLHAYFPDEIRAQFEAELSQHPLAREIIATVLTNRIADQAGCSFIMNLAERLGTDADKVAHVYLLFDAAIGAEALRDAVFALDNRMPADQQHELLLRLENSLAILTEDILDAEQIPALDHQSIVHYKEEINRFVASLSSVLPDEACQAMTDEMNIHVDLGMAEDVARQFSSLSALKDFLPVVQLVEESKKDLFSVFTTYHDVRKYLHYDQLKELLAHTQMSGRWDKLAQRAVEKQFNEVLFRLTCAICIEADCNCNTFFSKHRTKMQKWHNLTRELNSTPPVNLHPFTVMIELIETIVP